MSTATELVEKAIAVFDGLEDGDPDEVQQGVDEALGLLDQALEIQPNSVDALSTRAWLLLENGRVQEIVDDCERLRGLDVGEAPGLSVHLLDLSNDLVAKAFADLADADYDQALAHLDVAVAACPTDSKAHHFKGIALGYLRRDQEAQEALLLSVELESGSADTWLELAFVQRRLGELDEAAFAAARAASLDPQNKEAQALRRRLHRSPALGLLLSIDAVRSPTFWFGLVSIGLALLGSFHLYRWATGSSVVLVNSLSKSVDVVLRPDGGAAAETVRVPANRFLRRHLGGKYRVEIRTANRVIDQHELEVPSGAAYAIYNVLGAAPVYREVMDYVADQGELPFSESPAGQQLLRPRRFQVLEDVDYFFEPPPVSLLSFVRTNGPQDNDPRQITHVACVPGCRWQDGAQHLFDVGRGEDAQAIMKAIGTAD